MTSRFLTILRQYVALAKRMNRSYAEQVNALAQHEASLIRNGFPKPEDQERHLQRLKDAVEYEYGRVDQNYRFSLVPPSENGNGQAAE